MINIENKQFIFKYKIDGRTSLSGWGKWGNVFAYISLAAVSIPFIFLTYRAITEDSRFFIFSALFVIFVILIGPYQMWIKKYYFFGLTKDGTLIMKSVINFIPKSFEIKVQDIALAKQDNIAKSPSVLFYNSSNKLIARFNPMTMKYLKFLSFLSEIRKINPNIKLNFKGLDKINNDSKY